MAQDFDPRAFASVGPSPVQAVLLVDILVREQPHYRFQSSSRPGHLIQCVISGRTAHEAGGRRYQLSPGDVIWYHEDEIVRGQALEWPWRFYTVNFIAPSLSPPPFEARVQHVSTTVMAKFQTLLETWRDVSVSALTRELRVQARLLDLLSDLSRPSPQPVHMDPAAQLWWDLETRLRQDLSQPISLSLMQRLTGRSPATIARSCQHALNVAPMKRIKQIRMSLARGLVQNSDLLLKEIADRVGYHRIHEFSRDYRKHHGLSPRQDRAHG